MWLMTCKQFGALEDIFNATFSAQVAFCNQEMANFQQQKKKKIIHKNHS